MKLERGKTVKLNCFRDKLKLQASDLWGLWRRMLTSLFDFCFSGIFHCKGACNTLRQRILSRHCFCTFFLFIQIIPHLDNVQRYISPQDLSRHSLVRRLQLQNVFRDRCSEIFLRASIEILQLGEKLASPSQCNFVCPNSPKSRHFHTNFSFPLSLFFIIFAGWAFDGMLRVMGWGLRFLRN